MMRFMVLALLVLSLPANAQAHRPPAPLQASVQKLVTGLGGGPESRDARYSFALLDMDGDNRREAVVWLHGPRMCGTGGCPMFVLTPTRTGYRVISKTMITRPPIRALPTRTNGWRDLGVRVSGGGLTPHDARLRFDGHGYPLNPSVPPATRLKRARGTTLIDSHIAAGFRVFPR